MSWHSPLTGLTAVFQNDDSTASFQKHCSQTRYTCVCVCVRARARVRACVATFRNHY